MRLNIFGYDISIKRQPQRKLSPASFLLIVDNKAHLLTPDEIRLDQRLAARAQYIFLLEPSLVSVLRSPLLNNAFSLSKEH